MSASRCPICMGAGSIYWFSGSPYPAGGIGLGGSACHGCGGSGIVWPPEAHQEAARKPLDARSVVSIRFESDERGSWAECECGWKSERSTNQDAVEDDAHVHRVTVHPGSRGGR